MSITAVPLTELDAVNEMLSTGSESPISTLDESQVIDASLAQRILRTTSVEIQTAGWFFNEEEGVDLAQNTDDEIDLPQNILRIDTSGSDASTKAVQRGSRLWNLKDRTYKWPEGVTVDWVLGLNFDELPSSARNYITIRAARKYQDRYFTDVSLHSYTERDELVALSSLKDEQLMSEDNNMLTDSLYAINARSRS